MIRNNTIVDNNGFGVYVGSGTEPNISNCILWGHDGNDLADCNATYSCIEDSNDAGGIGNITSDPMFVNVDCNNYCLLPESPCIDAGDPNADYTGDADLYGLSLESPKGEGVEMGCSEDPIYYVKWDAEPYGDGSSWDDAFRYLQDALTNPVLTKGDSIWVARGTYKPDQSAAYPDGTGKQTSTFQLVKDIRIVGGFAGHETEESERNWKLNATILSGDIGEEGVDSDNSYNVVTAYDPGINRSIVLDGFIIEKGFRGMVIWNWGPTVQNCIFRDNLGSGMKITLCPPYTPLVQPHLINCTFIDNSTGTGGDGGAIYNYCMSPELTNCIFINNYADYIGGAIWNHCGGYYGDGLKLTNCVFSGNEAKQDGGAIHSYMADAVFTNCVFYNNSAVNGDGGALYNYSNCDLTITNCTFYSNHAYNGYGGGIFNDSTSYPIIKNSIFWGNTADYGDIDDQQIYDGYYYIHYSCIQDDSPGELPIPFNGTGHGNIDDYPEFADSCDVNGLDDILGTIDDGLCLKPDSPCIDEGNNVAVENITTDVTGGPRIRDGDQDSTATVDMGAYEYAPLWYVDSDAEPDGDGESWNTAFDELQDALDVAVNGDVIWVAEGTYTPGSGGISGQNATFELIEGVALYGGFVGNETSQNQRDWKNNKTYLSGDLGDKKVYHVVTGADDAVLDGFVIKDGSANGSNLSDRSGGGMYNCGVSPIVENCIFEENNAEFGGGMANLAEPDENMVIKKPCLPTIRNCTFTDNTATDWGAGMGNYFSSPEVINCLFVKNKAIGRLGGGMYNVECTDSLKLINCTFSDNDADFGGGMFNENASVTIINSILWNNTATSGLGGEIFDYDTEGGSHCAVSYSSVEGGLRTNTDPPLPGPKCFYCYGEYFEQELPDAGTGNVPYAPYFKDPANDDYHLESYSPCIDMGDPLSDYSNEPDYPSGKINLGAYGNTTEAAAKGTDTDGDGMPDEWENLYAGIPSPYFPDAASDAADDDGLSNINEYYYGTNPQNADTDGDNRLDGWEIENGWLPTGDEDVSWIGIYAHELPYVASFEPFEKYEVLETIHYLNGWEVVEGSAVVNYDIWDEEGPPGPLEDPSPTRWRMIHTLELEELTEVRKTLVPTEDDYAWAYFRIKPQNGACMYVLNDGYVIAGLKFYNDYIYLAHTDSTGVCRWQPCERWVFSGGKYGVWNNYGYLPWTDNWSGDWIWISFFIYFTDHDYEVQWWDNDWYEYYNPDFHSGAWKLKLAGNSDPRYPEDISSLTEVRFVTEQSSSLRIDNVAVNNGSASPFPYKWSKYDWYIDSPKGCGQETYTGKVPVIGKADSIHQSKYDLYFFPKSVWPPLEDNITNWSYISSSYDRVKDGGLLGTWNLSALSDGYYDLLMIPYADEYCAPEEYSHDSPDWDLFYYGVLGMPDIRVSNKNLAPSLSLEEVDISVPWPGQFPFELKRMFNHHRRFSSRPFPNGWTHNNQMIIQEIVGPCHCTRLCPEYCVQAYQEHGDTYDFYLGMGQILVTYPDGSIRVFVHGEYNENADTITYYPLEPELTPGDVVTRTPHSHPFDNDIYIYNYCDSIDYELKMSDGTVVEFEGVNYFHRSDKWGYSWVPYCVIDYWGDPDTGALGEVRWKAFGGATAIRDRFGNRLDIEWYKEDVDAWLDGWGLVEKEKVKPIAVTKVGYKRSDGKSTYIEFKLDTVNNYYLNAWLKHEIDPDTSQTYQTIEYEWDIYDGVWIFDVRAKGDGVDDEGNWSTDQTYNLSEYVYLGKDLVGVYHNQKIATQASYNDYGGLSSRVDYVDSDDQSLYPLTTFYFYDFYDVDENPDVHMITNTYTPYKIVTAQHDHKGRLIDQDTATYDGSSTVDVELIYDDVIDKTNPPGKPNTQLDDIEDQTKDRKSKYEYDDYWQVTKQSIYEKEGETELLKSLTDMEYHEQYEVLPHKKTTYQDLSTPEVPQIKVETIYMYGEDEGGTPSANGKTGVYLVKQKILTDESKNPDEYAETTYKYYEPLVPASDENPEDFGFGLLKETIDPEGNKTLYEYDKNGYKAKESVYEYGQYVLVKEFYYDSIGQLILEADNRGRVTHNYYDGFGRLWKVEVYEEPGILTFDRRYFIPQRYSDGTFVKLISRTKYGYDVLGNRTFEQQEILAGSPGAAPVLTTRGAVTMEYTTGGLPRKVAYETGGSYKQYYYDSRGKKVGEIKYDNVTGRDWLTLFFYDCMDRQTCQIWIDYDWSSIEKAQVTGYYGTGRKKYEDLYGTDGWLEKLTDYEYDILGRMTRRTIDKGGEGYLNLATNYSYDDAGNLDYMIDPCDNYIFYDYDNANRKIKEYFAEPCDTNPETTRSNAYIKKNIEYYANDLIKDINSYDYSSGAAPGPGTLLARREFLYDSRRRLKQVTEAPGESEEAVTSFAYWDPIVPGMEYKIVITHPGGTEQTKIFYHVLEKVSKIIYPSGKFKDMQYNGDGKLMRKWVSNPIGDDWIDYTYDNYGRLEKITYPDIPNPDPYTLTFYLDGFGRKLQVTDNRVPDDNIGGSGQIQYDYDVLGRIFVVLDQDDYLLNYFYRADGQKECIRVYDPYDPVEESRDLIYDVLYGYDWALRLNAVYEPILVGTDDLIAQLEYDNSGNRDKISYSKDGTAESTVDIDYNYNPDNMLTDFSTTGGPTFTFDATGTSPPDIDGLGRLVDAQEVLTKTDDTTVTYNLDYTYDMRSQLTVAQNDNINGGSWQADYSYYKNGNLKDREIQSSKTEFEYTGEIMDGTKTGGGEEFGLTWDDNGNMTEVDMSTGDDTTLVYNWDGKLRSAEKGTKSISLKYDPAGNRIFKDSSESGERKYIVDIVGDLPVILMELNSSGGIVKTYIYSNSQIIAQHTGDHTADRYFYLHDRLGSVRQVIDTSGDVKNRYTYNPFGELYPAPDFEETVNNPFKFAGQYFDSEIDEYYLRARQYDPHIARFTARDPVFGKLKEPMTLHVYLYCRNNPGNMVDLDGKWVYWQGLSFGAGVSGKLGFLKGQIGASAGCGYFYGVKQGTYDVFFGNYAKIGISSKLGVTPSGRDGREVTIAPFGAGVTAGFSDSINSVAEFMGYKPGETPASVGDILYKFSGNYDFGLDFGVIEDLLNGEINTGDLYDLIDDLTDEDTLRGIFKKLLEEVFLGPELGGELMIVYNYSTEYPEW